MHSTTRIAAAAVVLISFGAFAQSFDLAPPNAEDKTRPTLLNRIGLAAEIGGGVHGFVDNDMRGIMDPGGAWAARLTIGTRSYLAGEVAYVGTANKIRALGLEDRAMLLSNGVEGLARVNFMTGEWQPYLVAGYTYRRFTLQNTTNATSAVSSGDDDHEIPLGTGVAYRLKGFVFDGRFMVHPSVASDLIKPGTSVEAAPFAGALPIAISVAARVGFEF